ncbi:hypothetical protein GALMADRAFT_64778 [Galerina marginata CBS 339.88]|uniref:F-box domain-containing protein n=1 Tax=Galerina marginata (strain CBS 339.88) TaxID=685588 RepID=A0A067T4Z3_GALM3|nr:hypothetical protein GALMADRAFT_64778 [Galerina marginata CBS 339.88]
MNGSLSLSTVPQEVLEHIALFTGTDKLLGPPSSLIPLLSTNRKIYASLSISTNYHLYARIFCRKFDTAAPLARLGSAQLTSLALAHELRKRCIVLQRLRARLDSTTHARHAQDAEGDRMSVYDVLLTAYVMMLENEDRNKLQLVEYGRMKEWIREFWFDPHGASLAIYSIRIGQWPLNRSETALGMWLFWFMLNTDDYELGVNDGVESPLNILKAMALGAHIYSLTTISWIDFEPKSRVSVAATVYAEVMDLTPPPLATPAILSFLALVDRRRLIPMPPSDAPVSQQAVNEWDSEWGRCFTKSKRDITECFRPGSIEGVWEGFFTYTEFTAYAAMLAGASPTTIQKGVVGRHQQTWKLREHHLLAADHSDSDSGIAMDVDTDTPLRAGDPLRSYFPTGTQLREHREGLIVQDSGSAEVRRYHRASVLQTQKFGGDQHKPRVKDIIITGEGHSAWGQFNLVGRVRPCDGFISLSKDYVDGDRGKWLYRGYLVGNANGNFAGRWRDTLSPADVPGYEGCFVMSRRR